MIRKTISILCDSCQHNFTLSYDNLAQAHQMSQANGWQRQATEFGTLDICPACAEIWRSLCHECIEKEQASS